MEPLRPELTTSGTACCVARLAAIVMITAVPGASTSLKNGAVSPMRRRAKGRPCAPSLTTVMSELGSIDSGLSK
eukprot:971851-Prymnesium_polylepis.3